MKKFLLIFVLLFILCCTDSGDSCHGDTDILNQPYEYTQKETDLINGINLYRHQRELQYLSTVNYISIISRTHVEEMLGNDINHAGFDSRCDSIKKHSCAIEMGEVIAYNYTTCQSAINAWDNSEGHRLVISDPNFNSIGVCIIQNQSDGKFYYMAFLAKI